MATQAEIDTAYRAARDRWQRLEATTVRRVRTSYRRATDALANRIRQTGGRVTPAHLEALRQDLAAMTTAWNVDTLAALQRGVSVSVSQTAMDAWTTQMGLAQVVGGSARIRGLLQGTAEAETLAWMSRVGADGLQLSDRVWRSGVASMRSIEQVLETAVITGQSAQTTARLLEEFVRGGVRPGWWETSERLGWVPPDWLREWRTRQGAGDWRPPDWRAVRLARTEINAAGREATVMVNRTNPFYRGVHWRRSNVPYPCQICEELATGGPGGDGFWPQGQEPTPAASHPNCRCVIVPDYEDRDDVTRRLGDWLRDPSSQPDLEQYFGTAQAGGRPGLEAPVGRERPAPPPPTPQPATPTAPRVAFREATTAKEANEFARSLGVTRSNYLKRDLPIANRVNADLAELAAQGQDLPDVIELQTLRGSDANTIAYYRRPLTTGGTDQMGVNRGSSHWTDPAARQRSMHASGWQSTPDVQHVIRHEVGHKAHHDNDPQLYNQLGRGSAGWNRYTTDVRQLQQRLAREVSEYGASSPHEFVAEVFAGRKGGRTFSQEVMRFYEMLGGPPV